VEKDSTTTHSWGAFELVFFFGDLLGLGLGLGDLVGLLLGLGLVLGLPDGLDGPLELGFGVGVVDVLGLAVELVGDGLVGLGEAVELGEALEDALGVALVEVLLLTDAFRVGLTVVAASN
jgi:hypothetical protein